MEGEYKLLKKLCREYGEPLLDEIADVTMDNGQGDCYGCRCSNYCPSSSCHNAIKLAITEIIGLEDNT